MSASGSRNFPNAQIYLSQADLEFWTDPAKASIPVAGAFIEPTRQQLLPNRERIVFVKDGQEVVPGVEAVFTPGHTVGHVSYVVTSDGKALCVAGDIVHHHVVSLETPRLEFTYDTDGLQSVASRLRMLDMLVNRRIPMVAYHFPWPGLGYVAKHGDAYRYVPAALQTVL
jgi:glyoxylase-like metal-dependent hydrolase (beta-lactamase superfamily II)